MNGWASYRSTLLLAFFAGACGGPVTTARMNRPQASDVPARSDERLLVERFRLDTIAPSGSELERVAALRDWVHARWRHDSWHEPATFETLAILDAASRGERFRCVEYGFVLADIYQALGWPARIIRFEGDGAHVATEVFVSSLGKWVLMDAQFAAHVTDAGGTPMSGLELQDALRQHQRPKVVFGTGVEDDYLGFIGQYLRYAMVTIDRGYGKSLTKLLVLVRSGDTEPASKPPYLTRVNTKYVITHSSSELYARP